MRTRSSSSKGKPPKKAAKIPLQRRGYSVLSPAQRREIFRKSADENLSAAALAREALEGDVDRRSNLSTLLRCVHLLKSDAKAADLRPLAALLEGLESAIEAARDVKDFGLDLEVLKDGLAEVERWAASLSGPERPTITAELRKRTAEWGARGREKLRETRFRRA